MFHKKQITSNKRFGTEIICNQIFLNCIFALATFCTKHQILNTNTYIIYAAIQIRKSQNKIHNYREMYFCAEQCFQKVDQDSE